MVASCHGNCGYDAGGEEVGIDGVIVIWNWERQEKLHVLQGHKLNVNALAFLPGTVFSASGNSGFGGRLASAGDGGSIRFWDPILGGDAIHVVPRDHSKEIWDLKVSPGGKYIVTASVDTRVRVWDTETMTCVAVLPHALGVKSSAITHDPENGDVLILTGNVSGGVKFWRLKFGS